MSNETRKSLRSVLTRAAEAEKPVNAPKLLSMEEAAQVSGGGIVGCFPITGSAPILHILPHLPGPLNPSQW